ncbi:MAG TPA: alpha/beta hydrolase [Nitrolancea sp.]|jgi:haloacetate dehalogenase|nr:alpha/beta hydrolase [Nitrolancea sp.]
MFDGFTLTTIETDEAAIRVRYGGSGPPLLLLHGIPETHLMWHKIAPLLARDFTVVATDLRGYGDSSKPASTADHAPYAMSALARDQLLLMEKLGYQQFNVVGHDRGARCAYRLALDYPERVRKLAVLDIVPTGEAFRRADMAFSLDFWVWSFLAAPYPLPERSIGAHPELFLDHMLESWSGTPDAFPAEVRAEYLRTFRDPATIHAVCEEYRAAATLDSAQDEADRGRQRIACPVLALWSAQGALGSWYDPLAIWRDWANDVQGHALDCGHFLPEEAPDETYDALCEFFRG